MFKLFHKMKGQSTLEYAVLVVIIIGALLAIQTYIKRGVQGKLKSSTDDIGDQYSPNNTNTLVKTRTSSNKTETFGQVGQGITDSYMNKPEQTNTIINQAIDQVNQEDWGK